MSDLTDLWGAMYGGGMEKVAAEQPAVPKPAAAKPAAPKPATQPPIQIPAASLGREGRKVLIDGGAPGRMLSAAMFPPRSPAPAVKAQPAVEHDVGHGSQFDKMRTEIRDRNNYKANEVKKAVMRGEDAWSSRIHDALNSYEAKQRKGDKAEAARLEGDRRAEQNKSFMDKLKDSARP